jgi:hypothetical protein
MSIKRTVLAAAATLALSVPAYAAQISPMNDAVTGGGKPQSTLTLIMHGGGGFGGVHGGGFAMHGGGFGGMHPGGFGPRFRPGGHFGFHHPAFFHGGRTAFFHGHRGFFRHGRFFPFGVGLYGYGWGYGGGSCYWNCRTQGFGPGYCSAYAYNFCY